MNNILIIDDEASLRKALTLSLQNEGYNVTEASTKLEVKEIIQKNRFDIIVVDLFVPLESDGMAILQSCKQNQPNAKCIMMTAHGSIERAVKAVQSGADDFIIKGFTIEEFNFRIKRLLEQNKLETENRLLSENNARLQSELENQYKFEGILGKSKVMQNMLNIISRVVHDSNSTILIDGESGTGKELVARAIHYNSPRKDKPFVIINCTALPEHLLESELFGYEKGAFTGAFKEKAGKFEIANGGTIFLDEIGEISPKMQVELLRFTQDNTFERIGSNTPIKVDVRIITATNKNLEQEVQKGNFRHDLYYRLNVIPIHVPPLRERKEDITLLVDHYCNVFYKQKGRLIHFAPQSLALLEKHDWHGNVRELENLVERLVVASPQETIYPEDLPESINKAYMNDIYQPPLNQQTLRAACLEFEKMFLLRHLEKHRWNISEVARNLNERRDTLSRRIKKLGLKS